MTELGSSLSLVGFGALLGLLSSTLATLLQRRHDVTLRMLDLYLEARKDIAGLASQLANIDLRGDFSIAARRDYRDKVIRLFYQHYDLLPQPILESLMLLHVCLDSTQGGLYAVVDGAVVQMPVTVVSDFIKNIALFRNTAITAPLALNSRDPTIRANQAIKLHARHVLNTLSQYSSVSRLLTLDRRRLKRTGA
jgi:hypothetical protein